MARPIRTPDEVPTEQRLLDAAEQLFGAAGFEGVALADVAAQAGIRRPSLLYHFETKEALYRAVLKRGFAEIHLLVMASVHVDDTLADRVDRLVDQLVDFANRRRGVVEMVLRALVTKDDPGHGTTSEELAGLVGALEMAVVSAGASAELARGALLQIISAHLVRTAAGEAGVRLWREDRTRALAHLLLVGAATPPVAPAPVGRTKRTPKT
jgi:AcrR family transcriptional regulator